MIPDETRKRRGFFFSMTTLIAGMQNLVLVLETSMSGWKTRESLNCILTKYRINHENPNRVYCNTFGEGL